MPSICGTLAWTLLHVTLLVPRIVRWLLDLCIICASLLSTTPTFYKESPPSSLCPTCPNTLLFPTLIIITKYVQITNIPIMLFSPFFCHLPFLRSKYALQVLPRFSHFSPYMSERHNVCGCNNYKFTLNFQNIHLLNILNIVFGMVSSILS